ncbi:hypothetical protein [Lyngbya sp. PCC 8106]|uniref:hypothetical protein n=1 Tax=Lyngbya sp. (strain PCC 8106) TaxID=313612 RepID=UPI0000EAB6F1|nr:hypothetical protein [Lyngbya sp. PCC 8106]EAW34455.1 hypothetical protein L8106_03242 [Lyngbya sp. PCC 8106]
MSSPASGPFKSRLLNLIVENYQQFLDHCGLTWRQVQFSTSTTVQAVMYSVYSLFQSLVKGKKRLQSTQPPESPQLNAAQTSPKQQGDCCDQPILDLLIIAREEVKRSRRLKVHPDSVQAIASQRQTKKLVLVGADDQILDVLSWRQRVKLRLYISRTKYSPQSSPESPVFSAITLAQNYTQAITRTTEELGITLRQAWLSSAKQLTIHTPENHSIQPSSANFHQVQAVIWAAIDYFFFKDYNSQLHSESQPENVLSGNPQNQQLTPQPQKSQAPILANSRRPLAATSTTKSEKYSAKSLTTSPDCGLIMSDAIKYSELGDRNDSASREYLSAEATAVGYVKHPLEQVLEWLDRVLFWIEEGVIRAWEWIKQR